MPYQMESSYGIPRIPLDFLWDFPFHVSPYGHIIGFGLLIINDRFMANAMGISVRGSHRFPSDILHTATWGVHCVSDGTSHGGTEILWDARWEGPRQPMRGSLRSRGT